MSEVPLCVQCEENTFADTTGGVFSSSCKPCPTGTSTLGVKGPKSDTTECLPCPEGNYLRGGKCHKCIPGSFSDTPGAVDTCTPCAQGHYSSKTSVGSLETGIITCSRCMPGTVTDQIGTVNCTNCPAGYADDGLEMTTCIQCVQGLMAVNFECPAPIQTTTITIPPTSTSTPIPSTTTSPPASTSTPIPSMFHISTLTPSSISITFRRCPHLSSSNWSLARRLPQRCPSRRCVQGQATSVADVLCSLKLQ